jgi:hypothetical protein
MTKFKSFVKYALPCLIAVGTQQAFAEVEVGAPTPAGYAAGVGVGAGVGFDAGASFGAGICMRTITQLAASKSAEGKGFGASRANGTLPFGPFNVDLGDANLANPKMMAYFIPGWGGTFDLTNLKIKSFSIDFADGKPIRFGCGLSNDALLIGTFAPSNQ